MLNFNKLTLADIERVRSYFNAYPDRICDCAIGSTFMWRDYFNNCIAYFGDAVIFRSGLTSGDTAYTYPIGKDSDAALTALEEYCARHSLPLIFCSVSDDRLARLEARYGGRMSYSYSEDWMDYLYDAQALSSLAGRKYSAQRNHINKFMRLYPDCGFAPLDDGNAQAVLDFLSDFTFHAAKETESAALEVEMCSEVVTNRKAYNLPAGVLTVQGKVIGMSVGEIINDTLFVHIEKADTSYPGAYQVLTNHFLKAYMTPEVKYVNREEDVGDPGLRKSKQAYHPIAMLKKHTVKVSI